VRRKYGICTRTDNRWKPKKFASRKRRKRTSSRFTAKRFDNCAEKPILGDKFADEVVRHIDFDFEKLKVPKGAEITLPMRAKHLDQWTREFLAANLVSTVLHLGCGLDSRVFRIGPPATVRWYDVDMPDVIELRRRLYPERHDRFFCNRSALAGLDTGRSARAGGRRGSGTIPFGKRGNSAF
jgi:O-methyltransferase involved in polyketide biosynthesis